MAWQKVASLDEFGDREVLAADLAGTPIALFRLGNDIHATSGSCTHELADLADGFVEAADGTVECPLHQAMFGIRTGAALCAPATEGLKVYAVKVEGTDIFVDPEGVPAAAAPAASAAQAGQGREPAPLA